MSELRVERAADALIAADAARAAEAATRAGKGEGGTARPGPGPAISPSPGPADQPGQATSPLTGEPIIQPQIDLTTDLPADGPAAMPPLTPEELATARAEDEADEARRRSDPDWTPDLGYLDAGWQEQHTDPEVFDRPETPPEGEAARPDGRDRSRSILRIVVVGALIALGLGVLVAVPGLLVPPPVAPDVSASPPGSPGAPATILPGESPTGGGTAECRFATILRPAQGLSPADEAQLCDLLLLDDEDDWVEYDGSAATIVPERGDIDEHVLFGVTISPEVAAELARACGAGEGLQCGATPPVAGEYVAWGIGTVEPLDKAAASFYEAAIGFLDATPPEGSAAHPWKGPVADPLAGHNVVYTLRFPSLVTPGLFGPYRLFYQGEGQNLTFQERPSSTFAWVGESAMVGFIPLAEWDGAVSYRYFTYYTNTFDGGQGSGIDLAPGHEDDAIPAPATIPRIELR